MPPNDKQTTKGADDTEPKKQTVYVTATRPQGYRRLNRWFGPEETELSVTEAELAELFGAQSHLTVMTADMKASRDKALGKAASKPSKAEG